MATPEAEPAPTPEEPAQPRGEPTRARPGLWRRFVDGALLGQEDATALGMCRAAIVLVFTLSMLSHLGAVAEYFSDDSVIFGEFARKAFHSRWSLFFYVREAWAVRLIYAVGVLAHVCWMFGLFTRLSSVVAWLVWISMVGRNPLLYSMPDQWHSALAFFLMLLPTGRGFSLDARWRGLGGTVPVWCRRIIQLQLAALYVNAAMAKTGDTWRVTGEAMYYAAASPYNRHFLINEWLAALQPYVLKPATFAVLYWEMTFGAFVVFEWFRESSRARGLRYVQLGLALIGALVYAWSSSLVILSSAAVLAALVVLDWFKRATGWRWIPSARWLFLGFGVLMHAGIQLLLYVAWFSPLTVATYLAFLHPSEATRLREWARARLTRT